MAAQCSSILSNAEYTQKINITLQLILLHKALGQEHFKNELGIL